MRSQEKDYRYLLLNLIPQHRLPPQMRRDVELALVSGKPEDLRRQSVLALEELCQTNYLERTGLRRANGDIIAHYKRSGGRYSVSVSLPADEWALHVGSAAVPSPEQPPVKDRETGDVKPARSPGEPSDRPKPAQVRIETLDYVPEIASVFTVSGRAEPVLDRLETLLQAVERWLEVPSVRLLLLDDVANAGVADSQWLVTMTDDDLRAEKLYRECIETGVLDISARGDAADSATSDEPGEWTHLGVSPLFSMGKVCGDLKMYFASVPDDSARVRRLEAATHLVRQAVEFSAQIETITSIDALTQIYNRHFYDSQVSVEIERAMRSGNEVSMLVIDIDDFKRVNDELGHKKGDEALTAIAELIRGNLRKVDLPFRYGGEEFVILLPGTSEFESVHTAERLRRVIAEYAGFTDHLGRSRRITVSVGVSVYPEVATNADELFDQADQAMYRAKELGKNRVVLYKKEDSQVGRGE